MAVNDIVPVPDARLEDVLASASPDLLREMIRSFAQRMMDAEVGQLCGAGYGEVSPGRGELPQRVPAANGTPGPEPSSWRSPSCAPALTTRSGCWSGAAGPSGRWPLWWPPAICWG